MAETKSITVKVVVLIILGVIGYALYSPPFAAKCKSVYDSGSAWVRKQFGSAEQAWKKTSLSASVDSELKRRAAAKQQKQREGTLLKADPKRALADARASAQAKKPLSEAALKQQERASWSIGQKIANGRAFAEHKADFGFKTEDQMASHIDRVISFASSSNTKKLQNGGTLYWDERTRSVVIVDPKMAGGGTAFKPPRGRAYFTDKK
jgi:hypothetical protein